MLGKTPVQIGCPADIGSIAVFAPTTENVNEAFHGIYFVGAVAVDVGATEGRNFCQPSRILATPEFKADEENRTELKANSFLWTMLADFYTKYPSARGRFPSERLVATPVVRIPPAPPPSPYLSVFSARIVE